MLRSEGPLLTIDVSSRSTDSEPIDGVLTEFVGGRGVGTKLAHDRVPFDVDPLGPENRVYISSGPLQQSTMSYTGRMNATAVSPLTTGLTSSNAGGYLSRNFTGTGYSVVEFIGRSDELLGVRVSDDGVTFDAVPELREATVPEVTAHVRDEHGLSEENIVAIGPAGENLVRFASIMTSEDRAFGRGGLGAVLGSKNVKFVTFEGDSSPGSDIDRETQMSIHRDAATSDHIMKRQGTVSVADLANELGGLPTRYFSERQFEGVEGINGDAVEEKKYKKGTCSQCAFACKLPTRDDERSVETEGPEFETVMAFGSNCAVDDIVDVMKSNDLCDELGLDTISCGDTVASYLASEDAFGDAELVHETVRKIAYREGIGDTLAGGIARSHDELGVENWTVKNLEFPAHEGRVFNGQALSYATSNHGADHNYSAFFVREYPLVPSDEALPPEGFENKPAEVIEHENIRAFMDSGIICQFSRHMMSESRYRSLFNAPYDDLLGIGAKVVELERHFNNNRGFDRRSDTLPYDVDGFDEALERYYQLRGWNDDGTVPEGGTVASL